MPISDARVATDQASRYLQQLCKHWSHKFTVEFSAERGSIDFGEGRSCALSADAEALVLQLTLPDGEDAERMEGVVAEHLRRFAFREDLAVAWSRRGA